MEKRVAGAFLRRTGAGKSKATIGKDERTYPRTRSNLSDSGVKLSQPPKTVHFTRSDLSDRGEGGGG